MNEFTKNFEDFVQKFSKPMSAMAELNMEWASNAANAAESLGDLLKAKKAEDFIEAQMNYIKKMNNSAMDYMQKATKILSEAGKEYSDEYAKKHKADKK